MLKNSFLKNTFLFVATAALAIYVGGNLPAWYKKWQGPFINGDYTSHLENQPNKLTLYGTTTCEYCIAARAYLKKEKIEFNDVLIDKSPEAKEKFKELDENAVPILVTSTRMFVGFNEQNYADFIKLINK